MKHDVQVVEAFIAHCSTTHLCQGFDPTQDVAIQSSSPTDVGEEDIFLYSSRFFLAGLRVKLTLDRFRGENQSLITCTHGRDPEK